MQCTRVAHVCASLQADLNGDGQLEVVVVTPGQLIQVQREHAMICTLCWSCQPMDAHTRSVLWTHVPLS
jgi:hypothetical protein